MATISIRKVLCDPWIESLQMLSARFRRSDIGARLARGTFWSVLGGVVSRVLMLGAYIIVARALGRETYGEFGMIRSTTAMFLVFAGFGLGTTASKHVAQFRTTDGDRAGRLIGLSLVFACISGGGIALVVLFAAPWLAAGVISAPHLTGLVRIAAFILFTGALYGAQRGALMGLEEFQSIAVLNLLEGVFALTVLSALTFFKGLQGAVCALLALGLFQCLASHMLMHRCALRAGIHLSIRGIAQEWRVLWHFSLPAALGGLMVTPVMWACNAMLVNQPGGYSHLGVFEAANQWRLAILFIPTMVAQVALPVLSNLWGANDQRRYNKVLKYNILLNGGVAGLAALGIALLAVPIMASYGPGFESGVWVLVLLAVSSVLVAINSVVGQAIASKGRMWAGFALNLLWGLTLLGTTRILLDRQYGALGLALANLIAYSLHTVWVSLYVRYFSAPGGRKGEVL